jgi:hypothetical protein
MSIEDRVKILAEKMTEVYISDTYLDTDYIERTNIELSNCVLEMLNKFDSSKIDIKREILNDVNYFLFEFTN